MITVVDYARGNLFSLSNALTSIGAEYEVTSDPDRVAAAEALILPGVGAFGDAIETLRARGLDKPIIERIAANVPFLGICVGCQLLLGWGREFGDHRGLGVIDGEVCKLPDYTPDREDGVRLPNVGWRRIDVRPNAPLLKDLGEREYVYFVHSYFPNPVAQTDIAATCRLNGQDVPIAVTRGSALGVQFHPEKSGPAGLAFLKAFVDQAS